ncbi:hypothetical protein [Caballeronia sp. J97]|uniref:hypothetical protein n=1 Tax=Caballeronia sp. J97 TaxID=2805429 RepID=UPI002AB24744|nr:hypothetical protein [Caballeronia sp. J97]
MIISPPFLPVEGLNTPTQKWKTDPMMDAVDGYELLHSGVFPIAFDRRWHCGMHLVPYGGRGQTEPVRAIADGEVVAYRVAKNAVGDGQKAANGSEALNSNIGFVLLKHVTDTGEDRTITFYSLYMHLLDTVSLNELAPQPLITQAPPETSPNALPAWLLADSAGVQAGGGKKVYRKDQLGYVGKYQGHRHLHFEIFMAEDDFSAWFEQEGRRTALGQGHPRTPGSKDYWGHTYFVIPAGLAFVSMPPGNTESPFFPRLDAGALDHSRTLYVEAFFSRGERFMRAWIDNGDGRLVSLTPEPIQDKCAEYEYKLYERATRLYETCPSEGFELLRFGRILGTENPLLAADARATWVAVPFDHGKTGYIDVNHASIQKLSDADFPFFKDWQKIEDGNTPFDRDGLCGYDALCEITGIPDGLSYMPPAYSHDERISAFVQLHADARTRLRGFVCHARSEWDASINEERFRNLKEADGFFGKRREEDPHGYENFIKFAKQCQFMERTPFGEGKRFWFFHPLAFIRHFRKCGWLSEKEMLQLIPQFVIRKPGSHNSTHQGVWESPNLAFASALLQRHRVHLNYAMRKFKIDSPVRQACFMGNATQETGWFHYLTEGNRADDAIDLHQGWFGRGFLQLTSPNGDMGQGNNNYYKYFRFLGRHPNLPPGPQEVHWRNELGRDAFHASHSAGAYWVWPGKSAPTTHNPSRPQVDSANRYADISGSNERKEIRTSAGLRVWYYNQSFANCAAAVNFPGATGKSPPAMNGLVDRSISFINAMLLLADVVSFKGRSGENNSWPEYFVKRKI